MKNKERTEMVPPNDVKLDDSIVGKLKRRKELLFRRIILISAIGTTLIILIFFNREAIERLSVYDGGDPAILGLATSLLGAYFTIFIIAYLLRYRSTLVMLEEEQERKLIRQRLYTIFPDSVVDVEGGTQSERGRLDTPEEEYFSKLVTLNIENLATYYIQVKEHSNKSFLASIIMAILGYVLLCSALVGGFISPDKASTTTFITAGAGVLIEFVSAIFFYLYSKTVSQMKDYHDSLLSVQNILLSLRLVEGIDDKSKKHTATLRIIDYLIGQKNVH